MYCVGIDIKENDETNTQKQGIRKPSGRICAAIYSQSIEYQRTAGETSEIVDDNRFEVGHLVFGKHPEQNGQDDIG